MSLPIALLIRPLAVIAMAWSVLKILRVQHPASQHAVWTCALVGMVVVVPLSLVMPRWSMGLLPAMPRLNLHAQLPPEPPTPTPEGCVEPASTLAAAALPAPAAPHRIPRPEAWLLSLYFAGALAVAARRLAGWLLLMRLLRRSKALRHGLRESADLAAPATVGFWSPVVVLPATWRRWSADQRRAVLKHEFAHIRRGDLRIAALTSCVRSLLWFHPFAWWLAWKVTTLAEMSCDACVVEAYSAPAAYCRLLLEFTEQVAQAGRRAALPGLAMVGRSSLNQRIDRVFALSRGGLRKLARPRLVLALGMAPTLCFAATLHLSGSAVPAWHFAPFQVLMSLEGEHIGKLSPELVPAEWAQTEDLLPATPAERLAIPAQLSAEDKVFMGRMAFPHKQSLKLALIEPAKGDPYLFADVNLNGVFEPDERFSFGMPKRRTLIDRPEVILRVPLRVGPYSHYPIRVVLPEKNIYVSNESGKGGRVLWRSPFVFVAGSVEIGGVPVSVMYMWDDDKGWAYPDYGWQGMDCNGDGWIDMESNSGEGAFADNYLPVFHVDGHYVTTVSLDPNAGTFVVREHAAGDYNRIPLSVGTIVPDFAFTDLDGKAHQFSEFRGKYVLLDFWGSWCGPCRRELPDLEKAYQQFRSRGFVILGMGDDKDTSQARKALSAAGVTYPQSMGETGSDLVHKRFGIYSFPSKALLDPEGKIIAIDPPGGAFRAGSITATLDKLLPRPK